MRETEREIDNAFCSICYSSQESLFCAAAAVAVDDNGLLLLFLLRVLPVRESVKFVA